MNYIPGFSNYLETSLPRYAEGGAIMGGAALTPEQREDRRIAANTLPRGTSIVGPTAGKKPLSFGTDNTFNVGEGQEIRVVDAGGNVIFSGSGVEGAKRAVAVGQSISDDLGKDANFKIQTGERTINPDGSVGGTRYIDVARAAPSQTGLGFLADNVLPFAAAFIPGIGPIAGAALGSAVSSAAQGRNLQDTLTRAALAGGTAYLGGQVFGPATPGATPTPGGNIPSAAIPSAAIPTGAFDGILVNATRAVAPSLAGSAVGGALGSGLSEVTGYKTPAEKFAQQQSQIANPLAVAPEVPYDGIKVIGPKLTSGSGSPFGAAFPIPVNEMLSGALTAAQPTPTQQPETVQAVEEEPGTIVTGAESYNPTELLAALGGLGGLAAATAGGGAAAGTSAGTTTASGVEPEIVVTGSVPGATAPLGTIAGLGGIPAITQGALSPTQTAGTSSDKLTAKDIADYLSLGGKAVGLLGNLVDGGKGGAGQAGTYGGSGSGRLNPIFSAKLPSAGGLGVIGANRTPRALGDQDWLTYGTRPELNFYDYAQPATPVTQPIPNNPAGPIMRTEEPVNFARGGRTEFAVNGPGTGRSDDIPAVLSDGEYVIDAETVALLGDGSSKAGAKKLDELRIKVRKHKGKKLAKGRFSANAKRPEAYLSGGRV